MTATLRITEVALVRESGHGWDDWRQILAFWGTLQKGRADAIRHLRDQHRLTRRLAILIVDRYLAQEEKATRTAHAKPKAHEVRLQKSVRGSLQTVFDAWTRPADLARWLTTRSRIQLRVGGRYEMAGGTHGRYLELDPPRRIRMSWDHERQCPGTEVAVSISSRGKGRSVVRLVHRDMPSHEDSVRMHEVWSRALDALARFLEAGADPPETRLWVRATRS